MEFDKYQDHTIDTAAYPDAGSGSISAIVYCALAAAGEAGEIANKVKKMMRDEDTSELRDAIFKEIGDTQWYLASLCRELGGSLANVAEKNLAMLRRRQSTNTIHGSGDNREVSAQLMIDYRESVHDSRMAAEGWTG